MKKIFITAMITLVSFTAIASVRVNAPHGSHSSSHSTHVIAPYISHPISHASDHLAVTPTNNDKVQSNNTTTHSGIIDVILIITIIGAIIFSIKNTKF